jgi:hypothetical protein
MKLSIIIFVITLLTVLFICNTQFMRNLGDKFNIFVTKIIDRINKY